MYKKYLARKGCLRALLVLIDCFCFFLPKRRGFKGSFKRILVCNMAHLGDLVQSTAMLKAIRERFPDAEIDLLAGSWGKPLLEGHPLIAHIYTLDHWKLNRSQVGLRQKIYHYLKQRKALKSALKGAKHDMAIDLYPYFPNATFLLWQAKIPQRIGFAHGGFSHLLTSSCRWFEENEPLVANFFRLLGLLGIERPAQLPHPYLPVGQEPLCPLSKKPYVLLHIACGHPAKKWSIEKWKKLARLLAAEGIPLYCTGHGVEESREVERLREGCPQVVNCVNLFTLKEFCVVVQRSAFLISVDSVACHIASAYEVAALIIYTGINSQPLWQPLGNVYPFRYPTTCYPCHKKRGCKKMGCINNISAEEVAAYAVQIWQKVNKIER